MGACPAGHPEPRRSWLAKIYQPAAKAEERLRGAEVEITWLPKVPQD
ncbi:MAG: hypothetical protein ACR2FY_16640 [Pirellulaceae bacterium]